MQGHRNETFEVSNYMSGRGDAHTRCMFEIFLIFSDEANGRVCMNSLCHANLETPEVLKENNGWSLRGAYYIFHKET